MTPLGPVANQNAHRRVFDDMAALYDVAMLPLEALLLQRLRSTLFQRLHGTALEVGVGTGVNFAYYPPDVCLVGMDESWDMLRVAATKARACFHLAQSDVQSLPFADATFDSIVGTLLFCSVPDPLRGLRELRRVLKLDGRLILLEHVRGLSPLARQATDLLNPFWTRFTRSCNLNRETVQAVAAAGFTVTHSERHGLTIFQIIEARKHPDLPFSKNAPYESADL
jgi:ubiquinone/menaquinone biosynthesis C-methylase UbiE